MRFDDSLHTVLAADTSTSFGARAAFLQLGDLIARGRVAPAVDLIERLRTLRGLVTEETRLVAARGLALADPPLVLVVLLCDDTAAVRVATLRAARLAPEDWETLIARVGPLGRSVLRGRSDLPPSALRALERFGSTDFALSDRSAPAVQTPPAAPAIAADAGADGNGFAIADLVDRIERHQRERAQTVAEEPRPLRVEQFRFETDALGTIRWIDAAPREPLIGLSLRHDVPDACVDGVAGGALRHRTAFTHARLVVPGASAIGGDWRIAGVPLFDPVSGRFAGIRGHARRPFAEEAPMAVAAAGATARGQDEGLRRLVHELRTPTNAIAGFSELIETQMLGDVPPVYRDRAAAIRGDVGDLVGAIDDIDLSARLNAGAVRMRSEDVPLAALGVQVRDTLAPLAARRGVGWVIRVTEDVRAHGDALLIERLLQRLGATLLGAAENGETVAMHVTSDHGEVQVTAVWPVALAGRGEAELLELDPAEWATAGTPLLGIGFVLRLLRHLTSQLGGRLVLAPDGLTITLPAAFNLDVDQATQHRP